MINDIIDAHVIINGVVQLHTGMLEKVLQSKQGCGWRINQVFSGRKRFHGRDISMEWHTGLSALGSGV